MAKKETEAMEGHHHHEGCCCCGYGGGRGRFWKGVLVGLLAAWVYCRLGCGRGLCHGGMMGGAYCPAPHGQMAPDPAPKETPKK